MDFELPQIEPSIISKPPTPENLPETVEQKIETEGVELEGNLKEVTSLIDQADPEKFSAEEVKSIKGKLMLIFGSLGILGGGYAMKQLIFGAPANEIAVLFGGIAGVGGGASLALSGLVETIKTSKFGQTKLGKFLTTETNDPDLPPPDMLL